MNMGKLTGTAAEFDFQAGDIIAVTSTPDDGWWSGKLRYTFHTRAHATQASCWTRRGGYLDIRISRATCASSSLSDLLITEC